MRHDLQYAIRIMRRSPGFAAAAVLCIALGIGANTTMFSLINAAMLRTLPVSDPQRLAVVDSFDEQGNVINSFSYPQYLSMHAHARGLALLARTYVNEFNLSTGDVTDRPAGELVSDSYFSVLGISPAMGRTILPADDNVLVLSHRFWKGRFQGDRSIVGRTMNLNGLAFTVIGVAPSGFSGVEVGRAPDIFVPLAAWDRLMPGTPTLKSNHELDKILKSHNLLILKSH